MNQFFILFFNVAIAQVLRCYDANVIALTFDDSPSPNTRRIVNTLNKHGVTATFFVNGYNVIKGGWRDLRYITKFNHTIGTHTFSHAALEQLNLFNVNRELYDNELIFRMAIKQRPRFFRPPYFSYNDNILELAEGVFGYTLVATNLDSQDWATKNSTDILRRFQEAIAVEGQGYITLQHDPINASVDILDQIIKLIKSSNYRIVSLQDCLKTSSYQLDNVYGPNLLSGI